VNVKRGDRGPVVKDIQEKLLKVGFNLGTTAADGYFGAKTEAAVRDFQARTGLPTTGLVDDETYRRLTEQSFSLGERLLYLHSPHLRGRDVLQLQKALKGLGFNPGPLDGIFGPATERALREFQASVGIQQDGILGPATLKRLTDMAVSLKSSSVVDYPARTPEKHVLAGRRIAIDAGHGGTDPGAVGPGGQKESELVRDIAARIEKALEAVDAVVIKTYDRDRKTALSERAARANRAAADVFVSIHLNGARSPKATGTETLYFQAGKNVSESGRVLASIMQEQLVRILRRPDRGIHGRNLAVLRRTLMPAVIVEPLFITNPDEVTLLADEEWRQRIAMAVVRGLESYFARVAPAKKP